MRSTKALAGSEVEKRSRWSACTKTIPGDKIARDPALDVSQPTQQPEEPILLTSITLYAETQSTDVEIKGRSFVELLKKWSDATLVSYIDTDGNLYLLTKGSGLPTRAILLPEQVADFKTAIEKAIEWKKTAKENGLETTKEIKSIQNKKFQNVENGIKLYFFSANKAQQIDLIIKFFDHDNSFIQSELYFDQEQFQNLLSIGQKYDETKSKLKEKIEKNNLLK